MYAAFEYLWVVLSQNFLKTRKNNSTAKEYATDLDASGMTGIWQPEKEWHRIHGDGKSTTGGKFRMEIMLNSNKKYVVKLVENSSTIDWTKEYITEPDFETIVQDIKTYYGV